MSIQNIYTTCMLCFGPKRSNVKVVTGLHIARVHYKGCPYRRYALRYTLYFVRHSIQSLHV